MDEWARLGFLEDSHVCIGRRFVLRDGGRTLEASRWANPFTVSMFPRPSCIRKFRDHLASLPFFPSALQELSGKTLVCHCSADVDCHGDVLMSAFKVWLGWSTAAVVSASIPWSPQEFVEQALRADHPFCGIKCDPHIWASLFRLFTLKLGLFTSLIIYLV
jgi:hypothetical protein